ncbi:MAG: fumarylacetoacetate hydrolase family protein [Verrucomicrobia bacterium]|nr:fumarylacetoacetate hydrolase family protein [Verrucomicrobiota bacterium]
MKIIRVLAADGSIHHGCIEPDGSKESVIGSCAEGWQKTGDKLPDGRLLAPISPVAIIGIAQNYRAHAAEMKGTVAEFPVCFMKLPGSVQDPGGPIRLPRHLRSDKVDYEVELAVVIGKTCRNVSKAEALQYVAGYTVGNDVSARDWQKEWGGGQICRGKTFDTFCPLGPCLVTPDEIPDPHNLRLRTLLNGVVLQDGNTRDLIFNVPALISFLSGNTTLHPGTVILTGTPDGVGMARTPPVYLQPGDTVVTEIEGIGALSNPVVAGD